MRLIIFGANSFIGRHLIPELSTLHDVTAVARSRTFIGGPVHEVEVDVGDVSWMSKIPKDEKYDVLIWLIQSRYYRKLPNGLPDLFRVNVIALAEALKWGKEVGISRAIIASSGSVYSQRNRSKSLAEDALLSWHTPYAASKIASEIVAAEYAPGIEIIMLRPFGVYGPGQRDMVIARLIDDVVASREVSLDQGIGMRFTPIFVNDCVYIIRRLLDIQVPENPFTINVAGPETVSLCEIVEQIGSILNIAPLIRYQNSQAPSFIADVTRLRKLIVEINFTPMKQGLLRTIAAVTGPRTAV